MREMAHTLAFVPGSAAKLAAKDFHDINSSPLPSDLLRPAPRRPAPTGRENTTTVHVVANTKRRWSLPRTMRASGNCYAKSVCMGKQTGT